MPAAFSGQCLQCLLLLLLPLLCTRVSGGSPAGKCKPSSGRAPPCRAGRSKGPPCPAASPRLSADGALSRHGSSFRPCRCERLRRFFFSAAPTLSGTPVSQRWGLLWDSGDPLSLSPARAGVVEGPDAHRWARPPRSLSTSLSLAYGRVYWPAGARLGRCDVVSRFCPVLTE